MFAPTRKRDAGRQTPDAGQNPGATKIPLPLRAGDKNDILYDSLCHLLVTKYVNIIYKKKYVLLVTSNLDLKIKK